jgi:LPS-assembly lipoprotein
MTPMSRPAPALRYALVALLAAALLSACGFRPRGSLELPPDFREIYVEGPVDISDEIAIFLESGGASLVTNGAEADAVIKVQPHGYAERVVSVDAETGKAREFELLYTLDYSIRMKDGTMLIPPERFSVRRIYVFDPTAGLGASNNVTVLRRDMRQDAAQKIIRATQAALAK